MHAISNDVSEVNVWVNYLESFVSLTLDMINIEYLLMICLNKEEIIQPF